MDIVDIFKFEVGTSSEKTARAWFEFLMSQGFDFRVLRTVDFTNGLPKIYDLNGNKFSIDFLEDKRNYQKTKSSIKKELIGRAMGSGRYGLKLLDLSAGLGIDAIFLSQLGFEVTAIERNPLIYLALNKASEQLGCGPKFIFGNAQDILQNPQQPFDVIYFDPMFPEKAKSALPRQEMVLFRHLVGADQDADQVVQRALQTRGPQRLVVKRPMKAPVLFKKPESQIEGKLVRFDIYGVRT